MDVQCRHTAAAGQCHRMVVVTRTAMVAGLEAPGLLAASAVAGPLVGLAEVEAPAGSVEEAALAVVVMARLAEATSVVAAVTADIANCSFSPA